MSESAFRSIRSPAMSVFQCDKCGASRMLPSRTLPQAHPVCTELRVDHNGPFPDGSEVEIRTTVPHGKMDFVYEVPERELNPFVESVIEDDDDDE